MENESKDKIKVQANWLYIRDGIPHQFGLAPLKKYKKLLQPRLETRFIHPISLCWNIDNLKPAKILEKIMAYYQDLVNAGIFFPGRFGDWIKCSYLTIDSKKYINFDIIAQAAWIKPTMAADLGIFIKNNEMVYFVGIVRGNEPGKGKPAIIGGIMNCDKVLDSGAYTMLKETLEEGNLKIEYQGDLDKLRENYTISEIPVVVKGFEEIDPELSEIHTRMYYVDIFKTTEQERNLDNTKRVYLAWTYAILIDIGRNKLNMNKLQQIFKAGDDAAEMYIKDVTDCFKSDKLEKCNVPNFGLEHHPQLFKTMIKRLKQKFPNF
ncbi:MAG: hypothetical protein ACTSVU_07880 [Promethearchaeota archaeon]